jgi:hypothetical protein
MAGEDNKKYVYLFHPKASTSQKTKKTSQKTKTNSSTPVDSPVDAAKGPLGGRNPQLNAPGKELSKVNDVTDGLTGGKKKSGDDDSKDSSLKIKIELDLEVEIHLTARIKGDITIGLL